MAMSTSQAFTLFVLATVAAAIHTANAVDYTVTNTAPSHPGSARFDGEIGVEYTIQTLSAATDFAWREFQQNTAADRRDIPAVKLFLDDMDGEKGVAYAINDEIHYSLNAINDDSENLKIEFAGVLYHEMAHIWQWNGNGQTPIRLIEGIADFVRLKAGFAASHWVQPGQGSNWDQGYDVTARFLDYCNGLRNGFVAELNKGMKSGYSAQIFVDLLGKNVDQLWSDYKAQYGNIA